MGSIPSNPLLHFLDFVFYFFRSLGIELFWWQSAGRYLTRRMIRRLFNRLQIAVLQQAAAAKRVQFDDRGDQSADVLEDSVEADTPLAIPKPGWTNSRSIAMVRLSTHNCGGQKCSLIAGAGDGLRSYSWTTMKSAGWRRCAQQVGVTHASCDKWLVLIAAINAVRCGRGHCCNTSVRLHGCLYASFLQDFEQIRRRSPGNDSGRCECP